ncbi:DUF58 domain-containing protein [Vibrio sp. SS-MA-C1-2]|uniref:DUF58 domain-containing protein n=1 Tax=Vibrio sp. SS-MA-C1-2 TaxID=2908646 RepID=UPI001F229CBD|nr:DUF58 domain-containing protein [Vibrio sp. SS-MA-C1-2]UJF18355.1 DUF58 domain-containing protein [Vibrio sp. SS-MA-C1-2]
MLSSRVSSTKKSLENEDRYQDPRLYCQYRNLLKLKQQARGFTLLPRQQSGSLLAGRHQSKFRGRGLNFEELRHYHAGDDIRSLDWRVTLRTGKPHIRAYSEEKDHNVIICVDQQQSMFFSSVDTMKSVVAAEITALIGWRVIADNDRVGALIFNEHQQHWFKSQRSANQMMRILKTVETYNQQLHAENSIAGASQPSPANSITDSIKLSSPFSQALQRIYQSQFKDSVIILISDFQQMNATDLQKMKRLQYHNDLLCIQISDPLEQSWSKMHPDFSQHAFIASDGQLQLNIDAKNPRLKGIETHFEQLSQSLSNLLSIQQLPLISLDTAGDHQKAFKSALGGR